MYIYNNNQFEPTVIDNSHESNNLGSLNTLENFKEIYHLKPTYLKQNYAMLRKNVQILLSFRCCNICLIILLFIFMFLSYMFTGDIIQVKNEICPNYVFIVKCRIMIVKQIEMEENGILMYVIKIR